MGVPVADMGPAIAPPRWKSFICFDAHHLAAPPAGESSANPRTSMGMLNSTQWTHLACYPARRDHPHEHKATCSIWGWFQRSGGNGPRLTGMLLRNRLALLNVPAINSNTGIFALLSLSDLSHENLQHEIAAWWNYKPGPFRPTPGPHKALSGTSRSAWAPGLNSAMPAQPPP